MKKKTVIPLLAVFVLICVAINRNDNNRSLQDGTAQRARVSREASGKTSGNQLLLANFKKILKI